MGGGGGKGGGSGEAEAARREEQERQARIRAGTERINSIFDGGSYVTGQLGEDASYDPNATYYLQDGTVWQPTPYSREEVEGYIDNGRGGDFGVEYGTTVRETGTPYEKQFAEARQRGLYTGVANAPGQFTDDYFNSLQQNYINYANPQLEDQYAKAQRELTYALARGGLGESSVRAQKAGELQQLYDLNKQQVADQALSYATNARNSVEDARANLISTLNATGDAEGATNAALARASALSQPPAYSPLGQLFGDFTAGLGAQAALERANYYSGGQTPVRYSTGLFTPSSSSVKVS